MLVIIPRRLQYSIISVDFRAIILNKKLEKNKKKKHIDLTWFDRLPTSTKIEKKTFIIYLIKVT